MYEREDEISNFFFSAICQKILLLLHFRSSVCLILMTSGSLPLAPFSHSVFDHHFDHQTWK